MQIKAIRYSSLFARKLKKLSPTDKLHLSKIEKVFRNDCFDSRLHTHKLSGKLGDLWSFSISYQSRILFKFEKGEGSVTFVDVGSHDIYK